MNQRSSLVIKDYIEERERKSLIRRYKKLYFRKYKTIILNILKWHI